MRPLARGRVRDDSSLHRNPRRDVCLHRGRDVGSQQAATIWAISGGQVAICWTKSSIAVLSSRLFSILSRSAATSNGFLFVRRELVASLSDAGRRRDIECYRFDAPLRAVI